jgi:bifunctional ADP-heptose synthase (sugar kinase/adenylyltransferase)
MALIPYSELERLLDRCADAHIGVVGDFALDCYWTTDPTASLSSVETGNPTQPVFEQRYAAGAAGNVVINLLDLGCRQVSAFGVVGHDPWGLELMQVLGASGADTAGIVEQEQDWQTVAYVKPHVDGVEQNRWDFGDFNRLHDDISDRLVDCLATAMEGLDALIINVQARSGIHTPHFRLRLAALIDSRPDSVFIIDSRDPHIMYSGCSLKVNEFEAARCCGYAASPDAGISRAQVLAAAEALFTERGEPVFVTRGHEGMVVYDSSGCTEVPAIELPGEVDTVGAGDAALSGISAMLACGVVPRRAACVGALGAAVCASKLRQTGTATPEEILSLLKRSK